MILRKILVLISIVRGESDQKDTFETVKVNSGINVGKGSNFRTRTSVQTSGRLLIPGECKGKGSELH